MSYAKLIKRQVKSAFKAVGDLAVTVTLTRVAVSDYSFETKEVVSSAPETKVVKAIRMKTENPKEPSEHILAKLMFNAEELDDPDFYDTVTFDGQAWKFVPPYVNDGFTITCNLAKVV